MKIELERIDSGIAIKVDVPLGMYMKPEGAQPVFKTHRIEISDDALLLVLNHLTSLARKAQAASKRAAKVSGSAEHFDAFWSLYPAVTADGMPRRVAKEQCRAKWAKNKLDEQWPAIEANIRGQLQVWASHGNKYCPLTTTYINQKRWVDAIDHANFGKVV